MADQQAAAPSAAATPTPAAAATPPVATEAKPATSEKPKTGKARHEEIRAKLTAAKPAKASTTEPPAPDAPPGEPKPGDPPKPPEPEKKPAVGAVMRLTAENTRIKSELDELRTKLAASGKAETVESLRERVKKDPAVLLDVFGEDLDADEQKRLIRFNDAVLSRSDPAYKEQRERDDRVAKLEKELETERASKAEMASRERDDRAREHTASVLTDGHKSDDGKVVIDPAQYPYINHLAKVGVVDTHRGVMFAVRDMAMDFRQSKGRDPSDAEIIGMIGIAAGEAEKHFKAQAAKWQLPSAAPAPAPTEPARPMPRTIGGDFGARDARGVDISKLSAAERHALIRQRLRDANRQAATN